MKKKIYIKTILTVLICYSCLSSSPDFKTQLLTNVQYSLESRLTLVDSIQVNTKKGGLIFAAQSNAKISENVELFARINLLFEEGSHLALNDDTFKIDNALFPSFLYLFYKPTYFFESQAGIIKTARHYSPLLFNEPDLGLNNQLTLIDYENLKLRFNLDAKLINGNLTENRTGSLSKTNSYYSNLGVDLELFTHYISTGFLYSKYKFNNLNYMVAQDSRFMGATVYGVNNSSTFKYGHLGDNFQIYISFNQLLDKVVFYTQYITNTDSRQNALLFGTEIGLMKNLKFQFEQYEIESDSILAIYANSYFGRTNRRGEHASLNISDGKSVYSAHFYKNNTINSNIFQDELTIFTLEFLYNF